ncbi:hypothetical protein I4U23_013713 [Adineta vaga]|nr:hypothetical protein I4U23_013713 [Adineta vaga]
MDMLVVFRNRETNKYFHCILNFLVCIENDPHGSTRVIITLSSIISAYCILKQGRRSVQPVGITNGISTRKSRLQRHMLLSITTSTILFCATTLLISVRQIITAFYVAAGMTSGVNDSITQEAVLLILLSLNHAINFYVHCIRCHYQAQRPTVDHSMCAPTPHQLPLTINQRILNER